MSKIAIIGAGIGGLTAGCLLARKGHAVTLYESHGTPGGYTAGFWRNGFYFESGTLSFESSSQVFRVMKTLGVTDRVEFVPQRSRFVAPEFDFIPEDYAHFKQSLAVAFPNHRAGLARYFAAVDPMYDSMRTVMGNGSGLSKLSAGLAMARQYLKYRGTTITDFTAGFIVRDSRLFSLLKSFGYPDMSAWILGGALATILDDYWTVKGGMQSWADALAGEFTSAGGELNLRTRVERIATRNGAAIGIVANGRELPCDWVISACDYKKTFLQMLDNPGLVPIKQLRKIKENAVSEGIVTVYLGLAISNDELKAHMKLPHVMYFDLQPGADVKDSGDPDYFAKTSIGLYSPSLHDPMLAAAGKSCLMIQATAPYRWLDNWGGGDRDRYRRLKEQVRHQLVAKAGKVIPGLESRIEFADAATPLTYERFTGNSDGATSAWSWDPNKKFYKSLMKSHVRTPVKRLLIGSCWASQIGGVPGALAAAQACSKFIGVSRIKKWVIAPCVVS